MKPTWKVFALAVALGAVCSFPTGLCAQEPGAPDAGGISAEMEPAFRADIERLMEMTGGKDMLAKILPEIDAEIDRLLRDSFPGEPKAVEIGLRHSRRLSERMQKDFPALIDQLAFTVYPKFFSHDDVKGLIAFYETPLGRKAISAMPGVTRETMQLMLPWIQRVTQELQPELDRDIEALLEELKKEESSQE